MAAPTSPEPTPRPSPAGRELVVLVHGLWMAGPVCALLARRLRASGYDVASFSYRSVRHALEASAARLHAFTQGLRPQRVHFVGHSLGGLLVLRMLSEAPALPVGRVVLLGSPCNGCAAADQLMRSARGRALLGVALPGWAPEHGAQVVRRHEVGAIAGTSRMGIGMLLVRLEGPNDGVVQIAETRLAGLQDHVILPVTHSGMLVSARVAQQVAAFLSSGRFVHAAASL